VTGSDLSVVEVHETIAEALTGYGGEVYVSPPQGREPALELVALMLGGSTHANGEPDRVWRHAIAGGQRSVRLRRVL
jgi:hypothetical protein